MRTQTFMLRLAAALYLAGTVIAVQASESPAPQLDMQSITESVRQQLREELRCELAERRAAIVAAAEPAPVPVPVPETLRLAQHCELPVSQG